jgi:co-chaperonin GroES (HSP10)
MRVDTSKIVPVNGSMLVSDDKKDEVSKGGIVIPGVVGDDNVIIGTVHSSSPFLLESGKLQDPANVGRTMPGLHGVLLNGMMYWLT